MSRAFPVLLALLLVAGRVEAQGFTPFAKYGKWVLVAGAAGMNYLAIRTHGRADDEFNALKARCLDAHDRCAVGPQGDYLDGASEVLYQRSLRYDRLARGWLVGGEAALAGAAALFVWELTRPKGRPDNIPFQPEVRSVRWGAGFGLRVSF